MKLLLDTHIWIWIHSEPWKLTSEVTRAVSDPENELWVSAVSIWELVTLIGKKRLSVAGDLNVWIDKSRQDLKLREAVSHGLPSFDCYGLGSVVRHLGVN